MTRKAADVLSWLRLGWQRAFTDPPFLDHNELATKIRMLAKRFPCKLGHKTGNGQQPQEHDSRRRPKPTANGELAEILVLREQDSRLSYGKVKDVLISNRWAVLGNPKHVVPE
jgi:hypothetical protein